MDEGAIAHRLMGDWEPTPSSIGGCVGARHARRRCQPPLSVLPRPPARGRAGRTSARCTSGRSSGSGTASAPSSIRRDGRTFLWSRGEELRHRPLPGDRGSARRAAARGHGARRRGAAVERRGAAAVRAAAAAHRPQDARPRRSCARCPVVLRGVRPARARGEDVRARPLAERRARLDALLAAARWPAAGCSRPPVRAADLGGHRRRARATRAERRRRRVHAQAARPRLRRRAAPRRLVEVEDRAVLGRRRADLRAARQRPPRQPVHRLHLRRLGRRPAGAVRQGLLRADRRGDPRGRRLRPAQHRREVRPGAHR